MSEPAPTLDLWPAPRPREKVDRVVSLPGSKSLTNRALLLAALSGGPATVDGAPPTRDTALMVDALRALGVPAIHFAVGATAILEDLAEAGGDVIGVDWRQPLEALPALSRREALLADRAWAVEHLRPWLRRHRGGHPAGVDRTPKRPELLAWGEEYEDSDR